MITGVGGVCCCLRICKQVTRYSVYAALPHTWDRDRETQYTVDVVHSFLFMHGHGLTIVLAIFNIMLHHHYNFLIL